MQAHQEEEQVWEKVGQEEMCQDLWTLLTSDSENLVLYLLIENRLH